MPPQAVIDSPGRRFDDSFAGNFAENGRWHVLQEASGSGTIVRGVLYNFA